MGQSDVFAGDIVLQVDEGLAVPARRQWHLPKRLEGLALHALDGRALWRAAVGEAGSLRRFGAGGKPLGKAASEGENPVCRTGDSGSAAGARARPEARNRRIVGPPTAGQGVQEQCRVPAAGDGQ